MDQRKYSARKKHAWSALAFGAVALLLLLSYVLFYPRLRAWCTQNFQPIYLLWYRWTVWPVFSFTAALAALNGLNLLGPLQVKSPAARKAFLWGGALIFLLFGALLISFVLFQSGGVSLVGSDVHVGEGVKLAPNSMITSDVNGGKQQ